MNASHAKLADDLLVKARALNRELLPTTVKNAVFQVRRYRELVDGLIALCEEREKDLKTQEGITLVRVRERDEALAEVARLKALLNDRDDVLRRFARARPEVECPLEGCATPRPHYHRETLDGPEMVFTDVHREERT